MKIYYMHNNNKKRKVELQAETGRGARYYEQRVAGGRKGTARERERGNRVQRIRRQDSEKREAGIKLE